MDKNNIIVSISLKLAIILMVTLGISFNIFATAEYMNGAKSFLFFTIQSNFIAAVVAFVLIIFDILKLKGNEKEMPRWLNYLKFAAEKA